MDELILQLVGQSPTVAIMIYMIYIGRAEMAELRKLYTALMVSYTELVDKAIEANIVTHSQGQRMKDQGGGG